MRNINRLVAFSFSLTLLFVCSTTASAFNANRVAVLTWNIRGTNFDAGCGSERNMSDVKNQLQILKRNYQFFGISLDVFALQEVYKGQAYELAAALGIPASRVAFVQTRRSDLCNRKQFGTAILSRLPVVGEPLAGVQSNCPKSGPATESRACYLLPEEQLDFNRSRENNILSAISVRLPTGQKVRVYNAHLVGDNSDWDRSRPPNTNASQRIAWRQIQRIAELINGNSRVTPYPSVLAGDFNVHPPTSDYAPAFTQYNYLALPWYGFRDLWAEWSPGHPDKANPNGHTVPAINPMLPNNPRSGKRVDYIVTRDRRIGVVTASVPDTGGASNHRPMVAYLAF
jgi:endonuclease/exonuclease/phosphatase family metal-dependent hydrolase